MNVRDRILIAGAQLLHAQGIAGLTQPQVAKASGVSQSHITYYFPKRVDLLVGVAEHSVDEALAAFAQAGAQEVLPRIVGQLGYLPRFRMILGLLVAADQTAEVREALGRLLAYVRQGLARLLTQLGGEARPEQVLVCHAAFFGLAMMHLGRQDETAARELETGAAHLLQLLTPWRPTSGETP